ncbi:MAG: hypothetical protein AAF086_08075 [Planctomycetota bacterium]
MKSNLWTFILVLFLSVPVIASPPKNDVLKFDVAGSIPQNNGVQQSEHKAAYRISFNFPESINAEIEDKTKLELTNEVEVQVRMSVDKETRYRVLLPIIPSSGVAKYSDEERPKLISGYELDWRKSWSWMGGDNSAVTCGVIFGVVTHQKRTHHFEFPILIEGRIVKSWDKVEVDELGGAEFEAKLLYGKIEMDGAARDGS